MTIRRAVAAVALVLLVVVAATWSSQPQLACDDPPLTTGSPDKLTAPDGKWSIASVNIHKSLDVPAMAAEIRSIPDLKSVDVFLLQEASKSTPELAQTLGMHHAYAPAEIIDDRISGLAILSRFPMSDVRVIKLTRFDLVLRNRCRIALTARLDTGGVPLRVFNVHLDTRISGDDRARQLDNILAVDDEPGVQLIGGDFNTANFRWLFWRLIPIPKLDDHIEAVVRKLHGYGYAPADTGDASTFSWFLLSFRLDWIFTKGVLATRAGVAELEFTDHEAVWAELPLP